MIDAFQNFYTSDISRTLNGQSSLLSGAGVAVGCEVAVWQGILGEVCAYLEQATQSFQAYAAKSKAVNGAVSLGVAAGLFTVASGIAFMFPPIAGGLAMLAGAATVAQQKAPAQDQVGVVGEDYASLTSSFSQGMMTINLDLLAAEEWIEAYLLAFRSDYNHNPDNYSLTREKRRFGGSQGAAEDPDRFISAEILFSEVKMRAIAHAVVAIGERQRVIAGQLDGLTGEAPWQRGSSPGIGPLGVGPVGPCSAFERNLNSVTGLLLLEQKTAHRIAEHCIDTANKFTLTDAEIDRRLSRLTSRV